MRNKRNIIFLMEKVNAITLPVLQRSRNKLERHIEI